MRHAGRLTRRALPFHDSVSAAVKKGGGRRYRSQRPPPFDTRRANINDTIKDYNPFQDTILLAESAFASLEFGQLADSQFRVGATAVDGNDYLVYDPTNSEPRYDPDGNGVLASALIAKLPAGLAMTADEFFRG